ncbi:MAG: 30S ribosomal protein S1 [Candidatus Tectomicrobia bacterium]|nr:30S ribosomal protein S1 [Candidatus Tectomicrobia bacterium]
MTEDFEKTFSGPEGQAEGAAPAPALSGTSSASQTNGGTVKGGAAQEGPVVKSPSTATAVIPEDISSLNAETMERLYEESLASIQEGQVIKGTVLKVERDHVVVDVGYKSEGSISLNEFPDGGRGLKVGDEVDVFLETKENSEGQVVLSKEKANRIKVWDRISDAFDKGETVRGTVVARIKGGLTVDVGVRAFLPGSQVDLRPVRNLDQYIGQAIETRIIKLNRNRGNIVLSRRVLLEEERAALKSKTLETLQEGQVVEGVVKNITDYGAFIDLGGLDGLLHITDMSWGRVGHPSEMFKIGDTVKVMVLKFDRERERVSLGHKQITRDPWENVDTKYPSGTRLKGRVVSITDYGAFVELEEGVEGLVHVSEMTWSRRMRHPSKIVSVDDIVDAVVLNVDKDNKRISLGMKQVEENPWLKVREKYPVGSTVRGRVRNMTEFGAFLALEEGIDGLIHISDMSWTQRIKHPSDILKKGQLVDAVVLSIDAENERLSLGLKQAGENPWDKIGELHHVGENVHASVVKVVNFGAFAALDDGLEGLIHVSELAEGKVERPEDVVGVGEDYTVKIIKVDPEEKKLGLSLRAYVAEHGEPAEWKERRARRLEGETKEEAGGRAQDEPAPGGAAKAESPGSEPEGEH